MPTSSFTGDLLGLAKVIPRCAPEHTRGAGPVQPVASSYLEGNCCRSPRGPSWAGYPRRWVMDIGVAEIATALEGTLSALLGIRLVEATKERVVAELTIRDELRTVGGSLHGGTLMALADTVGATATVLNLPAGATTTTLESKTNFFAAGRAGVVRAETTPLHRGKRTMVWQTRVTDEAGRLLSLTIQTQMVLMSEGGSRPPSEPPPNG